MRRRSSCAETPITDNMPLTADDIAYFKRFAGNEVFIDPTEYDGRPRYKCDNVVLDLEMRAQVWIESYVKPLGFTLAEVVCYRGEYILDSNHILADYNFRTMRPAITIKLLRRKARLDALADATFVEIVKLTGMLLVMAGLNKRFQEAVRDARLPFVYTLDARKLHNAVGPEHAKVAAVLRDVVSKSLLFTLVELYLPRICWGNTEALADVLVSSLRSLSLQHGFCNVRVLAGGIVRLVNLENLNMREVKVTPWECRALAEVFPISVKTVDFASMGLSVVHMGHLAPALAQCLSLQYLEVSTPPPYTPYHPIG